MLNPVAAQACYIYVTGRNPQTGKEIKITARKVPSFVAGKVLKDAVN